jgi:hypothetical protein
MMRKNFSRRLERLEASLAPTDGPRFMQFLVCKAGSEEVIERFSMPLDYDPRSRYRPGRPWRQRAN